MKSLLPTAPDADHPAALIEVRRQETLLKTGALQNADTTRRGLGEAFVLEERGTIEVKGKGEMHTWFLNSRNGRAVSTLSP